MRRCDGAQLRRSAVGRTCATVKMVLASQTGRGSASSAGDIATSGASKAEHPAVIQTRLSIAERKHLREISDGPTPG